MAASQLRPGDVDWDTFLGRSGSAGSTRAGIFAGLSETTPEVIVEAAAASRHGTVVSYDLNYRPRLWKAIGGVEARRR